MLERLKLVAFPYDPNDLMRGTFITYTRVVPIAFGVIPTSGITALVFVWCYVHLQVAQAEFYCLARSMGCSRTVLEMNSFVWKANGFCMPQFNN